MTYRPSDTLTTQQVATVCQVCMRTVLHWHDRGLLGGHRLPAAGKNRGALRVPVRELARFLRQQGWLEMARSLGTAEGCCLIVSGDSQLLERLISWTRFTGCPNLVEAGMHVASQMPQAMVLDFALGREACLQTAMRLHQEPLRPTLIALVYEDEGEHKSVLGLFDGVLPYPLDLERLAALVAKEGRWR